MDYTVRIQGKDWPARYSLRTAMTVDEKFGDFKRAIFDAGETDAEKRSNKIFILGEMLKAGQAWKEAEEGVAAEVPPTQEKLLDMISLRQLPGITAKMLEIFMEDDRSDFEAEDPEGKNSEATPGR